MYFKVGNVQKLVLVIQIEYKSTFKVRNLGDFQFFLPKLMGSGTHCLKIDGFPGTHGTHANGATVVDKSRQTDESTITRGDCNTKLVCDII